MINNILNIWLLTKIIKIFRRLCILFPEINACRTVLDEIECIWVFLMKVEEFLEKYNEIWVNVSNMIKEINSELLEKIPKS